MSDRGTEISRCPTCGEECFIVHGKEGASVYVGMGPGRKCLEFHADYRRVVDWIKNPKRKQANLAFTDSSERQIAYAVEGVLRGRRAKA